MANSAESCVIEAESVPLNTVPGSGNAQANGKRCGQDARTCSDNKHHRFLAIFSIICGLSCIGIKALIYSVKAETTTDTKASAKFSQRAKKLSIISIVTWICILISLPLLMALVSYLFTLID